MKVCTTCGTEYPDDQKFCPKDGSSLRSTSDGSLIDSIIADRYHITSKLGEGGMGAVYLGEHVKMGRKSAIKVMSQSMANDPDAIARFNREAANAARINHPNVCAIYDFGETDDGVIYLAMEFIEGEVLTDLIQREGALDPARAVAILKQTADALQAAHDLEIVHRDLKPDNIMITSGRGGGDVVKVVDFGIAKAMGGEEGQNVTKTGLVVGTPEYMSPEQLSGDVLDGRSDTYSLALVFFRMLTGVLPFQADSAQETMIKRLTDDPLRLNDARPGATYPEALQDVMDRALGRMPSERYPSAADFATDAAAAIEGMPAGAPPIETEVATQLMDSAEVPSGAEEASAELANTRVAGEAITAPTPTPEPAAPTTPQPQPSPIEPEKKRFPVGAGAVAAAAIVIAGVGVGVGTIVMRGDNTGGDGFAGTGGVTGDTAQVIAQAETSTVRQGGGENPRTRDTTERSDTSTGPGPAKPDSTVVLPPPVILVDAASAGEWLFDRVMDEGVNPTNAAAIRDTAEAYYNHPEISQNDKAFAAFALGQAWLNLGDEQQALQWGQLAVNLDGTESGYRAFVATLRRQQ